MAGFYEDSGDCLRCPYACGECWASGKRCVTCKPNSVMVISPSSAGTSNTRRRLVVFFETEYLEECLCLPGYFLNEDHDCLRKLNK